MHPSVIAWNLANEIAGNGHDATEVAYVRDMAREIHQRRSRPGSSPSTSGARTRRSPCRARSTPTSMRSR